MLRKLILCLIVTVTMTTAAFAAAPIMNGTIASCIEDPGCGP